MAKNFHVAPNDDDETYFGKCGDCEFVSTGWATKTAATERMEQHAAEHESGEPMPELAESGIRGSVRTA